jgi:hypothetical protein
MALQAVSFVALVFTALALVPGGAHLFALANKIVMTEEQYFAAQMAYRGWWMMAFILIPAMLVNVLFALMLRGSGPAFWLALAACLCMAATLAIFFTWTYPANVATANWTTVPANWAALRVQWEYSHAVNAVLNFLAMCFVAMAVAARR